MAGGEQAGQIEEDCGLRKPEVLTANYDEYDNSNSIRRWRVGSASWRRPARRRTKTISR